MTTQEKIIAMMVERGMFREDAEKVLETAKPVLETHGRITWDRPASEYPDPLYAVMFLRLKPFAVRWIDENAPSAWFRPLFAE